MTPRLQRLFPFKQERHVPHGVKLIGDSETSVFKLELAQSPWAWGTLREWKSLFQIEPIPFEPISKNVSGTVYPLRQAKRVDDLSQLDPPLVNDKGKRPLRDHEDLHIPKRIRS